MTILSIGMMFFVTACNKTVQLPPVHTVSAVYIPQNQFECKGKVIKPTKQASGKYRDSDVARYMNGLYLRGDDCETKLHGVRDMYNRQIEAQKETPTGVDTPKPSN